MQVVKIVPPKPTGKLQAGNATKIFNGDGEEIHGVKSIKIDIGIDQIVTAEMTMAVSCEEVWALAMMSEASFLEAAKRYGYRVEKEG